MTANNLKGIMQYALLVLFVFVFVLLQVKNASTHKRTQADSNNKVQITDNFFVGVANKQKTNDS